MPTIKDMTPWRLNPVNNSMSHGMIFGMTGSGKSTLMDAFVLDAYLRIPDSHVLVIDSKNRYHAKYEANGLRTGRRYRTLRGGAFYPESTRLPLFASANDLKKVWQTMPGRILIAQTDKEGEYPWLDDMVRAFYEQASKHWWNLVAIDEMLALSMQKKITRGFRTVAVAGRERGVYMVGCSQRPRWIPQEVMTEMSNAYIFALDNTDDIDKLVDMGLPESVTPPPMDRSFKWYNKQTGKVIRSRLNLPG
jgi:DNA helicase HerA-like ATPase